MTYQVMLCKLGNKSDLNRKGYIAEPKLDGTRALLIKKNKKIQLINRRQRNILHRYPEFKELYKNIKQNSIIDGEIIVYYKGKPNFNLLQRRDQLSNRHLIEIRSQQYPSTFIVFDILNINNKNLKNIPLIKRKKILKDNIKENKQFELIFYTKNIKQLWEKIKKLNLEGIVIKKINSPYLPKRTESWIKIKNLKSATCIIIGYTQEKRNISALALAVYHKNKLTYIGRVGTGFDEEFIKDFYKKLKKIKIKKLKLYNLKTKQNKKKIQFVKPKYICEVEYLDISKDFILRAPSFKGLREDKLLEECIL